MAPRGGAPPESVIAKNVQKRKPHRSSVLSVKCPKKHNLYKTVPQYDDGTYYTCDYCGRAILHCRIECRTCNFDVCTVCYLKIKKGEQLPTFYDNIQSIPSTFICPITQTMMRTPVMNVLSGKIYEDAAIKLWIKSGRERDPLAPQCGVNCDSLQLKQTLRIQICNFVDAKPEHKSKWQSFRAISQNWEQIFKKFDASINADTNILQKLQSEMRKEAKVLLSHEENKNEDDHDAIKLNKNIVLQSVIEKPIVTIMGPARHGKSTLINDLLGVENACEISRKSNKSLTKGAWITLCSAAVVNDDYKVEGRFGVLDTINDEEKKTDDSDFYLIDMEGCSTGCTQMTKKLFYICYALSNVVIWNDKDIANDNFRGFMKEFEKEMNIVKNTDRKPTFLYLERDAGDFEYDPFESLDEYIKEDESFEWLRNMNIFASVNGYELDRRPNRTRTPFSKHEMDDLRAVIYNLCNDSNAFIRTEQEFVSQMNHVNKNTALSVGIQSINNNQILKALYFSKHGNYFTTRQHYMTLAAIKFKWDHEKIQRKYEQQKQYISLCKQRQLMDDKLVKTLEDNMEELFERVKNKTDNIAQIQEENRLVSWLPIQKPDDLLSQVRYNLGSIAVWFLAEDTKEKENTHKAAQFSWNIAKDLVARYELGPTDAEKLGLYIEE